MRSFLLLSCALALLAPSLPARAESVGTVASLERRVEETARLRAEIAAGESIETDDEIETDPTGWTVIAFAAARGVLEIGPSTAISIRAETAGLGTEVRFGKLRVTLSRWFRGEYWIRTAAAFMIFDGTVVEVEVDPDGTTRVRVYEGVAKVWATVAPGPPSMVAARPGAPLRVPAGFETLVFPGQRPLPPAPLKPGGEDRDPVGLDPGDPPLLDPVDPRFDPGREFLF